MANIKTFEKTDLEQSGKILVKAGAPWCGPCRQMAPILESLAETYTVLDVNIDENGDFGHEYGIRSLPTFLIFENGEVISTLVGAKTKQELEELLK